MRAAEFCYTNNHGRRVFGWIDSDGVVLNASGDIVGGIFKEDDGNWLPEHNWRINVNDDGSRKTFRNRADAARWLVSS